MKLLFSILLMSTQAFAITNFHQVTSGIFRGARLQDQDYQVLKQYGVRTIINIEDDLSAVNKDKNMAIANGFQFKSFPMNSFKVPSDQLVNSILQELRNPTNFPLYLHCKHGEDRTGLVMGLYRVYDMGWSPKLAFEEMKALGFHKVLYGLYYYFKKSTGFQGDLAEATEVDSAFVSVRKF
jgi:tyrosine-protein phosphatase SIW14